MDYYCDEALAYLSHAFDPDRALFSWTSSTNASGEPVHDFAMEHSLRYTINTYLGLSEAELHGGEIEWLGPVRTRVSDFLAACGSQIDNCGDHGLLLVLLAATDPSHAAAEHSLTRIEEAIAPDDAAVHLNAQELCWMLWGTTAFAGEPRSRALAERVFDLVRHNFVHPVTGMPRHSTRRYRAHAVSFGSTVYFLRAMYEYAETFDSAEARQMFMTCLQRVLALQGDDGAWPWMIDARTAVPIDIYPIFSVHQDSMAMLFLFPAQQYGVAGVDEAIERSFRWNLGFNELKTAMLRDEPYAWFYRSIERTERWPRARRYLRGLGPGTRKHPEHSSHVRVNRECRSYHPGWVLYTWSGRADTPGGAPSPTRGEAADEGERHAVR